MFGKVLIIVFLCAFNSFLQAQPTCVQCCCGNVIEVGVPGGNFEDPPYANPIIVYFAGQMYSIWTVNSGSIDLLGPNYSNWASGNPNGASQFIDLHGNTPGSFSTTLSGLNIDYEYTIVLWYAKNAGATSANCQIQVAGGAWLDQTWTATNNGANGWLQKCYSFKAQASSAELKFTGTGPTTAGGVLLDDITMFCCPPKSIPVFSDPPMDVSGIQCQQDIPPVPIPIIVDDCDNNPAIMFSSKTTGPTCKQIITRTWTVTNSCGSTAKAEQNIFVEDTEAPIFIVDPEDVMVDCSDDILSVFYDWINNIGGSVAEDNCDGQVTWTKVYNLEPEFPCSETIVTFVAEDNCGNTSSKTAKFIVEDLEKPKIIIPPTDIVLLCASNPYDSLTSWINLHANALVKDNCGQITWFNDFDGDKTKTDYTIKFTATDECNNSTTFLANFKISSSADTTFILKTSCNLLQVGLDTIIYKVNGCDSVVISNTSYSPADTMLISGLTCIAANAINDTIVLKNQDGCDSIIIKNIQYLKPDTTFLLNKNCSLKLASTDTLNYQGSFCDSIVIIQNIPLFSDTLNFQSYTCDSSLVGTFVKNFINQDGCDSVIITESIFTGFTFSNKTLDLCGTLQNYSDTLVYQTPECDSFVYVHYIYHATDTVKTSSPTCDKNMVGVNSIVLKNIWGCDSVVLNTVYLVQSDTSFITAITCNKSEAGNFSNTYTNQNGCDSLVILTKTYIKPDTTYISSTTCDPKASGIFIKTFQTATCDSVVINEVKLLSSSVSYIKTYSCLITSAISDTIKLQNQAGCDSLVINEILPKLLAAFYHFKNETCKGKKDGLVKIDSVLNGTAPFLYSLDGVIYSSDFNYGKLMPGNYEIFIKDSNGCQTKTGNIQINEGEDFKIELGPNKSYKEGSLVEIIPTYSSTPYNITWTPQTLFDCLSCLQNSFTITQDEQINLYAENENGCSDTDSLNLKVIPVIDVFIPNAFSPDLNGINDYFTIYGDEHLIKIKELNIYSRWGEQVFAGKNIDPNEPLQGWNGKFKGKLMDSAVFVFWALLEFDNGTTEIYKGDINLLR